MNKLIVIEYDVDTPETEVEAKIQERLAEYPDTLVDKIHSYISPHEWGNGTIQKTVTVLLYLVPATTLECSVGTVMLNGEVVE